MSLCFSMESIILLTEISLLRKENHVLLWTNLPGQQEEKATLGHAHLQHRSMLLSLMQNAGRPASVGHDFCRGPKHPNSVGRALRDSAVKVGLAWEHMCAWKNSILDHHRAKNFSGQNLDQESRRCLIWQEFLQEDKPENKLMRYTHVPPRHRFSSWPCIQNREVTCRSSSHLTTYPCPVHFILKPSIQLMSW